MSESGHDSGVPSATESVEAKAEMRRWVDRWTIVNRFTRGEAQRMTDDDVRAALQHVLEGFWDLRGPSDDGEGLIAFQQVLSEITRRRAARVP